MKDRIDRPHLQNLPRAAFPRRILGLVRRRALGAAPFAALALWLLVILLIGLPIIIG